MVLKMYRKRGNVHIHRLFVLAFVAMTMMGCTVYAYEGPPPRIVAPVRVYHAPARYVPMATIYAPAPIIRAETHVVIQTPGSHAPGCKRPMMRRPSKHHHGRRHRH